MSEETTEKKEVAAVPAKPAKSGGAMNILLTAILAAGGAFGGAKIAAAHQQQPAGVEAAKPQKAPGPTLTLQPFLVLAQDAEKKEHPVKLTLAIEFSSNAKEDEVKELTPRVRDAVLTFLRGASFDELTDQKASDKTRAEMLEKIQKSGATEAERILITDFVVQ